MSVNPNLIKYAAVIWRHGTTCQIISDTLNEDPIFRDTVLEIQDARKHIRYNNHMSRVNKNG